MRFVVLVVIGGSRCLMILGGWCQGRWRKGCVRLRRRVCFGSVRGR